MKWSRIRPGLYQLHDGDGFVAVIERGAETGSWWWEAWPYSGREWTLREAKKAVKERQR